MLLRLNDGVRTRGETPAIVPVALLREALARYGVVQVRALGASMVPLIPNGSICEIIAAPAQSLRVHDIVAIGLGDTLVIHRLIETGPLGLRLSGDNTRAADPWAPIESLLGRVDRVVVPSGASRRVNGPAWRRLAWPLRVLGFLRRR